MSTCHSLCLRVVSAVVAAFEQMKREFDFNISASVNFDLDANVSRTLQQMSQDIMGEVSSDLQLFQKLRDPLKYGGLILLAYSFLRSEPNTSSLHSAHTSVYYVVNVNV